MEVLALIIASFIVLALLGVVVAFSPTLILAEIAILTRDKDPVPRTLALISGIATAVAVFSLVAFSLIDPTKEINLPSTKQVFGLVPVVDIAIGLLLIVFGLLLLRPKSPTDKEKHSKTKHSMGTKTLYWFGLIKMATSLSSISAILIASRLIHTYSQTGSVQLAAIVWLVVISLAPFALIVITKLYRPQLFNRIQQTSDRVSELDWRRYIAGLVFLVSLWFLLVGAQNI